MSSILDIKPNKEKAIFLAKRQLPEFVCDAVNLEGINFTRPRKLRAQLKKLKVL